MSLESCPACNNPVQTSLPYCQYCGKPLKGYMSPEETSQCLSLATGRDWIAIAKTEAGHVFFIEVNPIAIMGYSNSIKGKASFWDSCSFDYDGDKETDFDINWDWENSTVRSFLNGPYLATLPKWVTERLVPIEVQENGKALLDNAVLLNEDEIVQFLERAPRSYRDLVTLESLKKAAEEEKQNNELASSESEDEYDFEDCYECNDYAYDDDDWGPRDPISRWKEDPRQYSKEGYDEWMNDYDSVLEAQKDWLWEQSWADEYESRERRAKEGEARRIVEDRRRRSLFDAGCEWTREGHESHVYDSFYLYEIAAMAAIRPVICFDANQPEYCAKNQVAPIENAKRMLPILSDSELDALISPPEIEAESPDQHPQIVTVQAKETVQSVYDDDDIPF